MRESFAVPPVPDTQIPQYPHHLRAFPERYFRPCWARNLISLLAGRWREEGKKKCKLRTWRSIAGGMNSCREMYEV